MKIGPDSAPRIVRPEATPVRETIRVGSSEVTVSPQRGGIITSIKLDGTEILYLDEATFADLAKNVRGGIPILFPNAGPVDDPRYPGLKQHGFARTSDQWDATTSADGRIFVEYLDCNASEIYPFDSIVTMQAQLYDDGTVLLTQAAHNRGATDMPVSMGLHPYFKVPADRKVDIRFNFPGGEVAEKESKIWMEGGTVSLDNPGALEVYLPGMGTLTFAISSMYKKIWVWSLPGQDFICIEPVMRDEGGLSRDPALIRPGETLSGTVSIHLDRDV